MPIWTTKKDEIGQNTAVSHTLETEVNKPTEIIMEHTKPRRESGKPCPLIQAEYKLTRQLREISHNFSHQSDPSRFRRI